MAMMGKQFLFVAALAGLFLLSPLIGNAAATGQYQAATGTPRAITPTTTATRTPAPAPATSVATGTPAPLITGTPAPAVNEILNQVTLVQHHYDPYDDYTWFTCASPGLGLSGVEPDRFGPRYVGPNAGDFDLWGVVGLFRIAPGGEITFVPQRPAPHFIDAEDNTYDRLSLQETLELFASGDAVWIGQHGEAGRIGECDPQYVTPTPTDDDNGDNDNTNDDNDNDDGSEDNENDNNLDDNDNDNSNSG